MARTRTSCEGCERWKEVKTKMRIAELLEQAAENFTGKDGKADFKPSLAEYLKLVQLAKEFEDDEVKEIRVKWVAPSAKTKEKSA